MAFTSFDSELSPLETCIATGGLQAGLAYLNARVPYRYTAVYRLDGLFMRNVALFDRLGEETPDILKETPLEQSFCQFVLRDGVFDTRNSAVDDRLNGHPFKGVMGSYVGLPLTRSGADLFGTFCHFDFPPHELPEGEYPYLQKVARLLPAFI
jgi:hypothetical protein